MRPLKISFGLGALIVGSAVIALYSVSFGHNFLFDEENIILRNPAIKDLHALPEMFASGFFHYASRVSHAWNEYYRPLTTLSFAVDYHFWKGNPLGYNLTNTMLHVAVCLLFYALLRRITGDAAAFLVTLLFGVHTMHVEAVTYIASRGDLLAGLGILSALMLHTASRRWAAVGVYGLVFLCKESSIVLPVFVAAYEWGIRKSTIRQVAEKTWPYFAAMAAFVALRQFVSPIPLGPPSVDLRGSALRFLSMGDGILSYFRALFFPEPFKFAEAVRFATRFLDPRVFSTGLLYGLMGAGWIIALRRRGAVFFGWTLFLAALAPYLHLVHFFPEWAEHYFYVPMIGLGICFAKALDGFFSRPGKKAKAIFFVVFAVYVSFLCVRTLERNQVYNDARRFYERLSKSDSPYAYYGYQNLARLDIEEEKWDDSILPLRIALRMQPHTDVTHQILAVYYMKKQRPDLALDHLREAITLSPDNTRHRLDAAEALMRMDRPGDAKEMLLEAQRLNPGYIAVYRSLIIACEMAGDNEAAFEWGKIGIEAAGPRKKEQASVRMSVLRLAFREGFKDRFEEQLRTLLRDYRETPWYGETAKLLAGELSAEAYLKTVRDQYAGFESEARTYLMIAFATHGDSGSFHRLLEDHALEEGTAHRPILRKEVEAARAMLENP